MDQEKYEVEAILDEKGRGSNKQFLVKWKHRAGRADARRAEARVQEQARQADALVQERAHQAGGQVQEEGARAEGQGQEGAYRDEDHVQEEDPRDEGQAQEEAHQAVGQEQEETRRLFASHAAAYRKAAAADAVRRDEAEASRRQHEIDACRFENAMIKLGMPAPRAEDEAAHSIGVLLNGEVHSPVRRVIGHEKKADGTLAFAVELENGDEVGILQEHIFQLCGQMAINYLASKVVTGML
ncbi:hypothetical protein CAEBREN_09218 [Caenorhabditis brenneri]|uniref:Chromo domain-containing protein n=1 Tax=Caenorhabditis brenneri TaxID=135651 RepID=G0MBK0_CAEBE|nr:hypothetical protein CAEBREN_09218 [Caenorhabditis brenneri]